MERKQPLDFSSYFYFEASGDSEQDDCDPPIMGVAGYDDHNDDALSCNYDGSAAELDEDEGEGESYCDEVEHEDDDKKSEVYGMSYCDDDDDDEMQEEQMKSHVSFDSRQDFVDEMEKNKLFWEACLAS